MTPLNLKYSVLFILFNLSVYSQEEIKIDSNLKNYLSLKEALQLKTEKFLIDSLNIDTLDWDAIFFE